jgi:outer membrane protein
MMMVRNVTNSRDLNEKGRVGIMAFLIMVTSIFLALMTATSEAYAQEAVKKTRPRADMVQQNPNVTGAAYEKLLFDADALIKGGDAAAAYSLLELLEFEHSGEERFDYLIGIAALDSGKPDKATLALERVLMVNPNSAAARLDIARAYYQLGDMLRAKTEFATALKQNPSATARANIEKYLDEIAAQESGKQTRITGYVEGAVGHDSNVNNSTSQSQVYVPAGPNIATLDPTNVKASDNYYGVAGGGEVTHNLNTNWGLYAGADLRQRGYHTQKGFDALDLDARAGVTYGDKADRFRIGALGGRYFLGNSRNIDIAGIEAEWCHVFSPRNQLKVFGQYAQYRYADVVLQPNDFDPQAVGGAWLHLLADGKSTLFGSLYHGMEKDVSTIVTTPATPNGGRVDGAKKFNGFRVGGQTAYGDKTTFFANAGFQAGNYSKVNYWFQQQRSDRFYDLTVGANWHWDKLLTIRPQLNYSKNDSNIVVYAYNRMDVSLNIRRDFR